MPTSYVYIVYTKNESEVKQMDIEKVTELVDEAKSIAMLLENDLYMQKQDTTIINAVKAIHHLLKDARESMV